MPRATTLPPRSARLRTLRPRRRCCRSCAPSRGTGARPQKTSPASASARTADRRRNARQRILDEQTARREQPARSLLSRLLQAAAAVFHRALHHARRHRLRPVHGPRHDGHRGGAAGPNAGRLRRQSAQRHSRRAPAFAADTRTGRRQARRARSGRGPVVPAGARGLLPSGHAPRNLRAARASSGARNAAARSTTWTAGFGWSR